MSKTQTASFNSARHDGSFSIENAPDLRRKHGREAAESLTHRATWLPEPERQLVMAVLNDGKSVVDLASLLDVPVRGLRNKVRRILHRMTSNLYAFVALHHGSWPLTLRRVADACVFRGLTIKQASRDLQLSYYTVRRHMDVIRTMFQTGATTPLAAEGRYRGEF